MRIVAVVGRAEVVGERKSHIEFAPKLHVGAQFGDVERSGAVVALHVESTRIAVGKVGILMIALPCKEAVVLISNN